MRLFRNLSVVRRLVVPITVIAAMALSVVSGSCSGGRDDDDSAPVGDLPDTLRVATVYGPLSFFYFRDDTMGYDYALIRDFARSKGLVLDITVASSMDNALSLLDSAEVDLVAYGVPVTAEYVENVVHCGPETMTSQVLVQPVRRGQPPLRDVTELVGKRIPVQRNSKYLYRLRNLNEELGGGILIEEIDTDTITDEDVVRMVATGHLPMSVVNSDIAVLNRTYYHNIDVGLEVSFGQKSAWAVRKDDRWLADSVSAWFATEGTRRTNETLLKRYFELSKSGPAFNLNASLAKGKVSPYDDIFRKQAARIGWDWRLLAAQGYVESQFNNNLVSWAGARGIMQIMPSTAAAYGIPSDSLVNPAVCIALAADILKTTENVMARYVENPEERRRFAVAAYNSGVAHIIDAIMLAQKHGHNPSVWHDNVEQALMMKSDPNHYNEPEVKYGYFRGRQTTEYVDHVYDFYNRILQHVPH